MMHFTSSDGTKGGIGAFSPSPRRTALPPFAPHQKEKMAKSSLLGELLDFCPTRNAFCPLDKLNISGAASTEPYV